MSEEAAPTPPDLDPSRYRVRSAIASRWRAGDPIGALSEDYGLPRYAVELVVAAGTGTEGAPEPPIDLIRWRKKTRADGDPEWHAITADATLVVSVACTWVWEWRVDTETGDDVSGSLHAAPDGESVYDDDWDYQNVDVALRRCETMYRALRRDAAIAKPSVQKDARANDASEPSPQIDIPGLPATDQKSTDPLTSESSHATSISSGLERGLEEKDSDVTQEAKQQVEDWNENYPIGTKVKAELPDPAQIEEPRDTELRGTVTTSEAWVHGGKAVVSVKGLSGGVPLGDLEVKAPKKRKPAETDDDDDDE